MAPLSQEVQFVSTCSPPHLGPAVAEMNSTWFKLWLYIRLGCGPISLLLAKGSRLKKLPNFIKVTCLVSLVWDISEQFRIEYVGMYFLLGSAVVHECPVFFRLVLLLK